jgi:hypothetical protein
LDGTVIAQDFITLVDDRRRHEIVVFLREVLGQEADATCSVHKPVYGLVIDSGGCT